MAILTRRSDPTHRIAFGTTEAAERFVATTRDPCDWIPDDLQAGADEAAPPGV